jgi:hypothetical protein
LGVIRNILLRGCLHVRFAKGIQPAIFLFFLAEM